MRPVMRPVTRPVAGTGAAARCGGTLLRRLATLALVLALVSVGAACSNGTLLPARDLTELVLRDSAYYAPEDTAPYTGAVFRYFPDEPGKVQLRGRLKNGRWNGELTVYHPNGRVRYLGDLADGVKCGTWTENHDPDPPEDLYQELKQEVESLGLYPPCPD
jgi:hypothetical protein